MGSECSWRTLCMQIWRKASLRAGGASHRSGTLRKNLKVMISPSRLDDDSWNFYDFSSTILPETYRQSLVRRPVFSLVRLLLRPWRYRVAPAAGESCSARICPIPCWLCHLVSRVHPYPHDPSANVATLEKHQSTARILVQSGPFGLAEQGLLFELCKKIRLSLW